MAMSGGVDSSAAALLLRSQGMSALIICLGHFSLQFSKPGIIFWCFSL